MGSTAIRPVRSKADEKAFIKFQWVPYKGNPAWVPPLLLDRRKALDRKNNPFYRHASMEMFLAERNGELVGRIAAIVNDNHIKEHHEKVGFFGFFESVNDQEVAGALFDAASSWLKERGMEAIRGPASPSVNDEYGLLIDGFHLPPMILMAYNPPYYQALVEGCGFAKAKDLYAYKVVEAKVFTDKLVRGTEIVRKRTGVTIRTIDFSQFDREVKILRELYSRGWESNWGEVPMTEDEFAYAAKDLKALAYPELVLIAEIKGKPVGFALTLPDYNQILIHNRKGHLLPALIRIALNRKKMNQCRIIILGVLPEYQRNGLGGLMFYETGRRGVDRGFPVGEASWVLEDNIMMVRGAELMGGEIWKRYRIYQKSL
jgi:GNAT superfamily N-acetyltransferase